VYAVRPLTAADARQIADWRYPAPYEFYDTAADPDDLAELLDVERWSPDSHFGGWIGSPPDDQLGGFYTFERPQAGVIEIGLGMRPDLTGRGHGETFIRDGLAFAQRAFDPQRFTLAVAAFNERAITVYRRIGFADTGRHVRHLMGRDYAFLTMALETTDA
jgi:[ribosomal protein S18]-alanine N-acetyltransferase